MDEHKGSGLGKTANNNRGLDMSILAKSDKGLVKWFIFRGRKCPKMFRQSGSLWRVIEVYPKVYRKGEIS